MVKTYSITTDTIYDKLTRMAAKTLGFSDCHPVFCGIRKYFIEINLWLK